MWFKGTNIVKTNKRVCDFENGVPGFYGYTYSEAQISVFVFVTPFGGKAECLVARGV